MSLRDLGLSPGRQSSVRSPARTTLARPSTAPAATTPGKYAIIENVMRKNVKDPENCVFLHPDEQRNYTDEELKCLLNRTFETRLFITNTPCAGDSVFLRTHHTDNTLHHSHFNYVRDYLKAAHATKNQTCAKATLTTLLTMCFDLSKGDYYTFAISLASGLSKYGGNTMFEFHDGMVKNREELDAVRGKFCLLMDVIFSKMSTKKFLLDEKQSNIFRLAYCKVKYGKDKTAIVSAFFSFTLQITLCVYVALHQKNSSLNDYNMQMLPLSVFTVCYSSMVAKATIADTLQAYELVFKKVSLLMVMDFVINIILPLALAFYGFVLILCEQDYINAVLNCSALLFIPEIDDQLPQILGYGEDDIIKNFLISEAMEDFDAVTKMADLEFTTIECARRNIVCGLQFGDFYITNMPERGTDAQAGMIFQPFQVTEGTDGNGHQIDPSTTITPDCLLCKIEWQYTTGFPKSSNPRVGCLTLTKIDGSKVKIERKEDPEGKIGINEHVHKLEGLFIITTFQMSEDVIRLRVCGSYNKKNFLKAFDYYSLWDVTEDARDAILQLEQRQGRRGSKVFLSKKVKAE